MGQPELRVALHHISAMRSEAGQFVVSHQPQGRRLGTEMSPKLDLSPSVVTCSTCMSIARRKGPVRRTLSIRRGQYLFRHEVGSNRHDTHFQRSSFAKLSVRRIGAKTIESAFHGAWHGRGWFVSEFGQCSTQARARTLDPCSFPSRKSREQHSVKEVLGILLRKDHIDG